MSPTAMRFLAPAAERLNLTTEGWEHFSAVVADDDLRVFRFDRGDEILTVRVRGEQPVSAICLRWAELDGARRDAA